MAGVNQRTMYHDSTNPVKNSDHISGTKTQDHGPSKKMKLQSDQVFIKPPGLDVSSDSSWTSKASMKGKCQYSSSTTPNPITPEQFFRRHLSKVKASERSAKYKAKVQQRLRDKLGHVLESTLEDFDGWGSEALLDFHPLVDPPPHLEHNAKILHKLKIEALEALLVDLGQTTPK